MSHAKRVSSKQSGSSRSRKTAASLEPLFLSLYDGSIPAEINEQSIEKLRHNIIAWTKYIDRLSSPQSMDADATFYVARARLRRGVVHSLLGEWPAALSDLSWVIEIHGSEAETNTAYLYRAQAYDALEQDEASIQDWTTVLMAIEHASSHPERFPNQLAAQGYAFRGRLHCRQEHYQQAVTDCDRALAFDNACAEAYSVRGRARSLLGKWSMALSDCTKAIELEGWPVHYYRRGLVQKEIGNDEQAFSDFEQAYRREPENGLFKKEHTELLMRRLICRGEYTPSPQEATFPVETPSQEG